MPTTDKRPDYSEVSDDTEIVRVYRRREDGGQSNDRARTSDGGGDGNNGDGPAPNTRRARGVFSARPWRCWVCGATHNEVEATGTSGGPVLFARCRALRFLALTTLTKVPDWEIRRA